MLPLWVLWWLKITYSSVVAGNVFERMRNSSLLSMPNYFPAWILVAVLLYWREEILFVISQSWRVSLIRYENGIPAAPMRVASTCTIWDLTSYQFVPMKKGIGIRNSVLWEIALGYSMEYLSIMDTTQSQSNAVEPAVSYSAPSYFTANTAQRWNTKLIFILVVVMYQLWFGPAWLR